MPCQQLLSRHQKSKFKLALQILLLLADIGTAAVQAQVEGQTVACGFEIQAHELGEQNPRSDHKAKLHIAQIACAFTDG